MCVPAGGGGAVGRGQQEGLACTGPQPAAVCSVLQAATEAGSFPARAMMVSGWLARACVALQVQCVAVRVTLVLRCVACSCTVFH